MKFNSGFKGLIARLCVYALCSTDILTAGLLYEKATSQTP